MDIKKYWISFVLGAVLGAVAVGAVTHSFPWCRKGGKGMGMMRHDPQAHLERMSRDLDLTDAQKPQVRKILEDSHAKLKSLHSEAFPRFKTIHDATKKEIRELLGPQQQTKFDKMTERFERKMDRWSRAF